MLSLLIHVLTYIYACRYVGNSQFSSLPLGCRMSFQCQIFRHFFIIMWSRSIKYLSPSDVKKMCYTYYHLLPNKLNSHMINPWYSQHFSGTTFLLHLFSSTSVRSLSSIQHHIGIIILPNISINCSLFLTIFLLLNKIFPCFFILL